MLRSPRPIPRRYSRRASRFTKSVVQKYHRPQRSYNRERWRRSMQRWQERSAVFGKQILQSFWWILGAAFLGVLLITLFSPLLTVREIRISRQDPRVDVELVERAMRPIFGKRMLFVGDADVSELLSEDLPDEKRPAMPDLQSLTIGKEYPSTLVLHLTPQRIVAAINIIQPDSDVATETGALLKSFLTEPGMLVEYLPSQVPDSATLEKIDIVDWGARPDPWTELFEPEVLQEIRRAQALLQEQFAEGVQRRVFYLRSQEYHFLLQSGITLWLDRKSSIDEQLARYKLFLKVTPKSAAKTYVDLRLRDRIIYR